MDELELRLLNDFQRDFPLSARPYRNVADVLGCSEADVLGRLASLRASAAISRVGAAFVPGRIGAATLAAMAVPAQRLPVVAGVVSAFQEVNHNYERGHDYNLWFVVTAEDRERVDGVVRAIETEAGAGPVLSLPMVESYHLDLGFDLRSAASALRPVIASGRPQPLALSAPERRLVAALQEGLSLVPEPYADLAERAGLDQPDVLMLLSRWLAQGVINRLGVIVRHRQLGYRANAMVVWDVPDGEVGAVGRAFAQSPAVTLCYRRERRLPAWRYNLYCMIHGRGVAQVLDHVADVEARSGLPRYPREVLFSRRCFKQRGARYLGIASPRRVEMADG